MKTEKITAYLRKNERREIDAYIVQVENRKAIFAIHRRLYLASTKPTRREFPWTITHIPTGYCFSEFRLRRDADFVARQCYSITSARVSSKNPKTVLRSFPTDFGKYLNYIRAYCGLLKLPTYTDWKNARA